MTHNVVTVVALCAVLALPGLAEAAPSKRRRVKKNYISLVNVNTGDKITNLRLIWQDPKNRNLKYIRKDARRRLNRFFRDRKTGKNARVPDKLLWMLYLVAYHYDRPVELVSGLRTGARNTSRHHSSKAADIRVDGVSPKALWQYCKRFKKVGLGWYPTSRFVHIDVRDKAHYWIDDSGPGEAPNYRPGVSQPVAEWRAQRAREQRRRQRASR